MESEVMLKLIEIQDIQLQKKIDSRYSRIEAKMHDIEKKLDYLISLLEEQKKVC